MTTEATPTKPAAKPAPAAKKPQNVQKEDAMWLQKEMINRNYDELAGARESGRKVAATFVPGNLNELLMCFDFARSLPETNALQNGMRKKSGKFIMDAERDGHSEDVCTYVKADLGMMQGGEIGHGRVGHAQHSESRSAQEKASGRPTCRSSRASRART